MFSFKTWLFFEETNFYYHLKWNIVYSLIRIASLVNICIYPRYSFCSSVYKMSSSQYFKIYVVYFMGNTVRLCANVSYICFSVSRYFLSTSRPVHWFQKFQNLNLKLFYWLVLATSAAFCLFKVFQF